MAMIDVLLYTGELSIQWIHEAPAEAKSDWQTYGGMDRQTKDKIIPTWRFSSLVLKKY